MISSSFLRTAVNKIVVEVPHSLLSKRVHAHTATNGAFVHSRKQNSRGSSPFVIISKRVHAHNVHYQMYERQNIKCFVCIYL